MHSGHGQWTWQQWPIKMHYLEAIPLDSKHTEASFSLNSTDLEIFLLTTTMTRLTTLPLVWSNYTHIKNKERDSTTLIVYFYFYYIPIILKLHLSVYPVASVGQ